ncbi:MAG: MFS transporter [Caldilineaceae bacterium]
MIALSSQFGSQSWAWVNHPDQPDPHGPLAFAGALAFAWIARAVGTKRPSSSACSSGRAPCSTPYGLLENQTQFFVAGRGDRHRLGRQPGAQSLLFSQMIPGGQEAEYFSLYEVSERGTSWLGLVFGLALQFTGNYRLALLSVAIFFAAGLILLFRVDVRRAIAEAGNLQPERI